MREHTKSYSPKQLISPSVLKKVGDIYLVNRDALLVDTDCTVRFFYTMSKDYHWNYSRHDSSTVFFKLEDSKIIGGIFDDELGILTRTVVFNIGEECTCSLRYIYSENDIRLMYSVLQNIK